MMPILHIITHICTVVLHIYIQAFLHAAYILCGTYIVLNLFQAYAILGLAATICAP